MQTRSADEELKFSALQRNNSFALHTKRAGLESFEQEKVAGTKLIREHSTSHAEHKTIEANHLGYDFKTTDHIRSVFYALKRHIS